MPDFPFTCHLCGGHTGAFKQEFGQTEHQNKYECIGNLTKEIELLKKRPAELTDAQVEQVDKINHVAFHAMTELLDPESVEWDMAWIGPLSDALCKIAVDYFDKKEMDIYPYIDEEEPWPPTK